MFNGSLPSVGHPKIISSSNWTPQLSQHCSASGEGRHFLGAVTSARATAGWSMHLTINPSLCIDWPPRIIYIYIHSCIMLYYVVLRMIYIHNDMMLYAVYLYINISIFRICSCSNKRTLHRTTRIRAWPLGHRTPPQYWAFITWPPSHMALQPASWMGSGIEYALDQYGEMNLFTYIFHASTCTCMYKYIRIRILHNIIHIYIYTYLCTLQISTVKPMCLGWLGLKLHPACFLSLGGTGVWAHFVEVEASTFGMEKHGPTDQKMG